MPYSTHTPGPWKMVKESNVYRLTGLHIGRIFNIANVFIRGDRLEDAEALANARLVAAAPELLEAAQKTLAWYAAEANHSTTTFCERVEMCRESENALKEAVAKALGGSNVK